MIKRYAFFPENWFCFVLLVYLVFFFTINLKAQSTPIIQWDKALGGSNDEDIESLQQTSDGGYILGGYSQSGINGDKTQANRGDFDYWVVKLDAAGNKLWDKTYGGSGYDLLTSLQQTSDGGYILGGMSNSPVNSDKSQASKGQHDYWIIKLDANGNKIWDKTFGGNLTDQLRSIRQTSDGGYILGGYSPSGISGDKSQASKGNDDYWVIKVDANGNKTWDKTFGGSDYDQLWSARQTADGGYILGGSSSSNISVDKTQASKGYSDYWIIKLDVNGNKLWDKTIGGSAGEQFFSLQQTSDGGYILGGMSDSPISGDKSQNSQGGRDYWVVKTDASGNKTWDKTFGGSSDFDWLYSVKQTQDGGYILGGASDSPISGDKSQNSQGNFDFWVVKLQASGNKSWDKTIGGSTFDMPKTIIQTADGGYFLGGFSDSWISGDKTQASKGGRDFWVVKLAPLCVEAPVATSGNNCGAGSVTLSASGTPTGGSYAWYSIPAGGSPIYTSASGTFTTPSLSSTTTFYVAAVNNVGCEGPRTAVTAIINTVSINASSTDTVCALAAPLQLSGFSPAGGVWSGPGVSAAGVFTPSSSLLGNQILTYTVTQNGCTASAQKLITVTAPPVVNAGSPQTICATATPIQLTGFSPAGGTWTGAGVTTAGLFTPNNSLIGTQILTYSITQNGCTVSATKQVIVQPVYKDFLGPDTVVCEGGDITLRITVPASSYLWNDGSQSPFLKVKQSGKYWVQCILEGCISTDTIQVTFKKCPEPFIPNIVTQNGDGKNDTFNPQYLPAGKWQLQIFNRWGVKLFETANYQNNWPDKKISDGTYYYLLRHSETGQQYKGWVEVAQ